MALDIKPTRSELINLKRRIKQTSSGYNLLKMKRDGLFHEFRTLLSEMISAREELVGTYREAVEAISLASAIEGGLVVKSAAIANSASPEVEVSRRNIMGVVVPQVEGQNLTSTIEERGTGLIGGSPYIDEAADCLFFVNCQDSQSRRNGGYSEATSRRNRSNQAPCQRA